MEVIEPPQFVVEQTERDEAVSAEHEPAAADLPGKVMTAAEMLGGSQPPQKFPPHVFHQGMLVTHPEYGPGAIVALSGAGAKRTATIQFFDMGQKSHKKFRLAQSQLAPVKPPQP
jgi:DNA helicase-2/ATP-dependent DNA helicase PcrA